MDWTRSNYSQSVSVDEDRFKRSHRMRRAASIARSRCPSMRIVSSGVTEGADERNPSQAVSVDEDRFKRSHSEGTRGGNMNEVSVDEDRFKRSHSCVVVPATHALFVCPSMRIVSSGVTDLLI